LRGGESHSGYHVSDLDLYQITTAQLTIDREVEQSLVA
jgi:hypothetical protein